MNTRRRQLLQAIVTVLAGAPLRLLGQSSGDPGERRKNFRYIYANASYRDEFKGFLSNVFHLFPEDEMHELIRRGSASEPSDAAVYRALQSQLDDIKPWLGDLTYALPALAKQKTVLADQSAELVGQGRRFEGYLEVGSNGRYLDSLEERFDIVGDRFVVGARAPSYSLVDILDRGQLFSAGEFIAMNDYQTEFAATIPRASVELANVFIGFHHCPVPLRAAFIGAIRDCLKPGAQLIVRDHNVHDDKMWHMVALAHDVFNMGTGESWDYNARERRHFYPLDELDAMLTGLGFTRHGGRLFQAGDPTLNALMVYRKR